MFNRLTDLLAPDLCGLCAMPLKPRSPHLLCSECWRALPRNAVCCARCAIPLARTGWCGACARGSAGPIQRAFVPLLHSRECRFLVHRFKYHHDLRAGRTLSFALRASVLSGYSYDDSPQALLPVPMSWQRQLRRGFNQADWIARDVSAHWPLPVLTGAVSRQHTPPQASLSRQRRQALAAKVFKLKTLLPYNHIAIIDDVLTTGATTRALARQLRAAGVERIDLWCVTRAVIGQPW